jgi:hypothetical protein
VLDAAVFIEYELRKLKLSKMVIKQFVVSSTRGESFYINHTENRKMFVYERDAL